MAPAVPTAVPTIVPATEEPTEVPTEVPVVILTEDPPEEPTPIPIIELPEICQYTLDVPVPQKITMDLREYGEYELYNSSTYDMFLMPPFLLNPIREAEADVSALIKEGGEFSFIMPSAGIIFTKTGTVTIDGELWSGKYAALSPSGEFIIPAGSQVHVKADGVLSEEYSLIEAIFLSGNPVNLVDVSYPDNTTLSCENVLWKINYKNSSTQIDELLLSTGHSVFIIDTVGSILGIKLPYSKDFEVFPNATLSPQEINLQMKQGGSIDAWVIDLYSEE